jgi:hypothetical protein
MKTLRAWRLGAIKKIGQTDSRKGAKAAKEEERE